MQCLEEPKGVAAADEESRRIEDRPPRVGRAVDPGQREPHPLESEASLFGIRVAVEEREGNEENRRRLR